MRFKKLVSLALSITAGVMSVTSPVSAVMIDDTMNLDTLQMEGKQLRMKF